MATTGFSTASVAHMMAINGRAFSMNGIDATPRRGTSEIWEFRVLTNNGRPPSAGHQMVVTSVIINNDFFESLSAEIQEGLQRAAKEAAVKNMEWMRGYEKDIYGHFEEAGLDINTLDLTPFREAVRPVWDKYAERVGG